MVDYEGSSGKVEVHSLACPHCGAPIKGSGACGSCDQLLLVTREYGVLEISDDETKGIKIESPKDNKEKDPAWKFDGETHFSYKQSVLTILGKGSPEVGARMVAMYYVDHPEEQMAGGRVAGWRDIEDYSIARVLSDQRGK